MENERHYFAVGLFVMGGMVAAFFTILWFSTLGSQQRFTTYAIYFDGAVSGLSAGSPVLFKGLNVGRVDSIDFKENGDDRIVVLADIEDSAPVRSDTLASIRLLGITGASALALENSGEDPSPLSRQPGEKYLVIASSPSGLEKFFDELPRFIDRLTSLTERAEGVLSDENLEAFTALLNASSAAMGDVSALTRQARGMIDGQAGGEFQNVLTEAKLAMREIKMLAKSLREDPSKILRGPKYEGQKIND